MKHICCSLIFCWLLVLSASGQVRLEDCIDKAHMNYPLVRQYDLLTKSEQYSTSSVMRSYIPQISVSGKVSYQSEATTFPIEIPGLGMKGLPKDQYQVVAEMQQVIWDGGNIRGARNLVAANTEQAREQLNTAMYELNERINQIFFGILMLDRQLEQNRALCENLCRNLATVQACFENGTVIQSDVDAVQVELLNAEQQAIKMQSARRAYVDMLALFTGEEYGDDVTFVAPDVTDVPDLLSNNRPELSLYDARENVLRVEKNNIRSGFMPRLGLFFQGGYGNPGLDMLKDEFTGFYIAGVRLSWNFSKLYTLRNDRRDIDTRLMMLDAERNTFILNTRMKAAGENREIESLRKQLAKDEDIVRLRTRIRESAEAEQLNGTKSVSDMLAEVNKEYISKMSLECRRIELIMTIYKLKNTLNN